MTTNVTVTGTTCTVTDDGSTVVVTAASTSTPAWGSISGTLANQADLTSELAGKAATVGLYLPGTSGNYPSCPDAAALDIVGDLTLIVRAQADDWSDANSPGIIGKWTSSGSQLSYALRILSNGVLRFAWSPDGTGGAAVSADSTAALPFADGVAGWFAVTIDVDNGASGRSVRFFTATDSVAVPTSWTQLGTTVTTAGVTSIFAGTAVLTVGTQDTVTPFKGTVYRAFVASGIGASGVPGGTTVASPDFTQNVGPRHRDAQGNVWTLNGSAWSWRIA